MHTSCGRGACFGWQGTSSAINPLAFEPPVFEPPVFEPPVFGPPVFEPPVFEPPVFEPPGILLPPSPPVTCVNNCGFFVGTCFCDDL